MSKPDCYYSRWALTFVYLDRVRYGRYFAGKCLQLASTMNKQVDTVRRNSAQIINEAIDQDTGMSLRLAANNPHRINNRLEELKGEWDIERSLELNAATTAFTGLVLGLAVNRKWLILPAAVAVFLAQHAIQGWCPLVPLLRRLGIRTRSEIDREQFALKLLRGDFGQRQIDADFVWAAVKGETS